MKYKNMEDKIDDEMGRYDEEERDGPAGSSSHVEMCERREHIDEGEEEEGDGEVR